MRNLDDYRVENNYAAADFLASYYYNKASFYLENNQRELSSKYLLKVIALDNASFSLEYKAFINHRQEFLTL